MKASTIILILFVSFINADRIIYSKKYVNRIADVANMCTKKEHIDRNYSLKLDDIGDFPSRKEIKCLSLCMIELFGLLNEEHRFLLDAYLGYMEDPVIIERATASVDKCLLQYKKIDSCEVAYDLHQCVLMNF